MTTATKPRTRRLMTQDDSEAREAEWLRRHLARAPERDEEWIRRALLLQGKG
ncbi:hypothetical protein ACWDBP_06445 [Streptomyces sp. NPDC001233]